LEGQDDFSARTCEASSIESVDPDALRKLRELHLEKKKNSSAVTISDEQFLSDLSLMADGKLTYAGVILLAKKSFLDRNLGNAEVCFEYRNRFGDGQSRNDRVNYREPFVLAYERIWGKIESRQQTHPFIQGLLRREIPAFNEEVFREALFNAVCHRDYSQKGSIFIIQSPEGIEITNPGGFPFGVTQENIINAVSTPRNRLLAESFERTLPGVERSGWGVNKIFRITIDEGKGLPDYSGSGDHFVRLFIPAMLQDAQFVQYLEKISNELQEPLSIDDLLLLEKIRSGNRKGITLKTVGHLVEKGFIELYGKTRGARYVLGQRYYSDTGKLGERTRITGLPREKYKEWVLRHLRDNKTGTLRELEQLFENELRRKDISINDIRNFLSELKREGKIVPSRKGPGAQWSSVK
jgi:ATP-dependent DNA helicase RecG